MPDDRKIDYFTPDEFVRTRPESRGVSIDIQLPENGSWLLRSVMDQPLDPPVVLRPTDLIYPVFEDERRLVAVQIVGEDDARLVSLPHPLAFHRGQSDAR